ncbi:diheme cytochrome c [Polaromonas naphthalenivorans]|uniref:Diheme cytochrome c n=1 Tax=Polaromonas naphthalenivorans (strain CJ2) TaxID=365044 RepID=A1VMG9_POLNA|nr:diheme cytochrome c [Polaromonas naphthalenivorans]ABM36847.1 diheme cytochrome c [Polaromonas naphthalenivorans CJ2]
MSFRFPSLSTKVLFGVLATICATQAAMADGDRRMVPLLPQYKQECAACHLAYPPGMLPAASWKRVMAGLPKHYGTDASLDPATVKELSTWLGANAGTYKRVSEEPPQDRITTSSWFERKHREVAPDTWKRAAIGSRANCAACHTRADKGDFDEDNVRIPK